MTYLAHFLIMFGGLLAMVAGVGTVRFSTAYARIHAAGVASPIAFLVAGVGAIIELDLVGAGYIVIAGLAMLVPLPMGVHLLFRAVHRTTDNSHLQIDDLTAANQRPHRDVT